MRRSLLLDEKLPNPSFNPKSKFDKWNAMIDCLFEIMLLSTLLSYSWTLHDLRMY